MKKRLRVVLSWGAARDDVGVAGYRIYRNRKLLGSVTRRSFVDRAVSPRRTYRYAVRAFDAAGKLGAAVTATVKTPPT
jgi:hypothetical protein